MNTVDVEVVIKPVGRRKPRPEAHVAQSVTAPRIPRIARLMALAIKFQDMVDRREVRDYADLARLGYVSRARVTQVMNLLHLAPDLQEMSLDGTLEVGPRESQLRSITRCVYWADQRMALDTMCLRTSSTSGR